ncbi:MAG: FecR domain-containing protein [Bacteriovoracia bacterium]
MKTFLLFLSLISLSSIADTYEVAYQKGKVEIFRNKKLVSPPVMSGDLIKVHRPGLLVLKSSQETLKIMHDTVIRPRETKEGTIIDLVKGGIVSLVKKKSFKIKTRAVSMGVRGTQFFVQATGKDDVWMCVNEGVVNVLKNKKSVDVPAGKGVFVDQKEISKPAAFAWTKKINWKMNPDQGELDHKINLNYDILENFYD